MLTNVSTMAQLGAPVLRLHCPPIFPSSSPFRRSPRLSKLLVPKTLRTGGDDEGNNFLPSSDSAGRLGIGTTRLGRLLRDRGKDLANRFRQIRRNLPLKVFLVLLGFYSANALATVLGQTGDWDVLIAAIMVALTEGIGFLMYRLKSLGERLSFLVTMINYWKAGLSFGLFVDAFKLGS